MLYPYWRKLTTTEANILGETTLLLANADKTPLSEYKIKSAVDDKLGSVTTLYENPTFLTDETMNSIELGGNIIKLPTTLEELGNDYKLIGFNNNNENFISKELRVFDEAGENVIGTVSARECVLTYKGAPLADAHIYGYEKFDLEKCPIVIAISINMNNFFIGKRR